MDSETTFGDWLRQRRRSLDMTQADLARQVGCSEITIRKIESDDRTPSRQIAELLATCLDLPAAKHTAFIAFARGRSYAEQPGTALVLERNSRTRLPIPLTRLLGRSQEVVQIRQRLLESDTRLLTLVGPPGVGKTRLGLHVAAECEEYGSYAQARFCDGVVFVSLAAIHEPALLLRAIAEALDIAETRHQSLCERLITALHQRSLLLVLDNCEHLLAAMPEVAQLLMGCPGLTILATSRAALRLRGEQIFPVAPLALPCQGEQLDPQSLAASPAVALFVERSQAVAPGFQLTQENVATIAVICRELDGLPLAIELVAARSRLLPPAALLARLGKQLDLLADGPSDLPAHQRTLRNALDWSYTLLDPVEQQTFAQLGVFSGGFTLAAAEAICLDTATEHTSRPAVLLDTLAALIDKSLLQSSTNSVGEPRFTLLETLRAYAIECLRTTEASVTTQQRHASYYAALARGIRAYPSIAEQEHAIERLHADDRNLWAALEWYATHDPGTGLQCAYPVRQYWLAHGQIREGRNWLSGILNDGFPLDDAARAVVHASAGFLACAQGDYDEAQTHASTALTYYRLLNDPSGVADALLTLSRVALLQSSFAPAEALAHEALLLYKELNNPTGIAEALRNMALTAKDRGDLIRAAQLCEECLAFYKQLGDRRSIAKLKYNLSTITYWQGEYIRSQRLAREAAIVFEQLGDQMWLAYALEGIGMVAYQQQHYREAHNVLTRSFELLRALDEKSGLALVLHELGLIAQARGDHTRAIHHHRDGLALAWRIGDKRRAVFCLESLAAIAGAGRPLEAARLFGAAEALRETLGTPVPPATSADYMRAVTTARAATTVPAFEVAWAEGRAATPEQIIEEALEGD